MEVTLDRPYVHQAYPKWLFHKTKPATLVQNPEQHAKLGGEWLEAPYSENAPVATDTDPEVERIRTAMGPAAGDLAAARSDEDAVNQAITLWTTPAEELLQQISVMGIEALAAIKALEGKNPRAVGGRKSLLAAITLRMEALVSPAAPVTV